MRLLHSLLTKWIRCVFSAYIWLRNPKKEKKNSLYSLNYWIKSKTKMPHVHIDIAMLVPVQSHQSHVKTHENFIPHCFSLINKQTNKQFFGHLKLRSVCFIYLFIFFLFQEFFPIRRRQYHKADAHPTKDIRSRDLLQTEVSNKPVPPRVTQV